MSPALRVEWHGAALNAAEEERLQSKLEGLERRLVHQPEPSATITVTDHPMQRLFDVSMRVQLGPLGPTLISHQSAETVDVALNKAIHDVERQLERRHGKQRGEPSFGVPSRRRVSEEES